MMRGTGAFEGKQPLGWNGEAARNNINNVPGIPGWSPFADPKSCIMPGAAAGAADQGPQSAPAGPVEAFGEGMYDVVTDPTEPAVPPQDGWMGNSAQGRRSTAPAKASRPAPKPKKKANHIPHYMRPKNTVVAPREIDQQNKPRRPKSAQFTSRIKVSDQCREKRDEALARTQAFQTTSAAMFAKESAMRSQASAFRRKKGMPGGRSTGGKPPRTGFKFKAQVRVKPAPAPAAMGVSIQGTAANMNTKFLATNVDFAPETTEAPAPAENKSEEVFAMPVKQLNDNYKRDYGDGHPSWSPFYNHHGEALDYNTCGKEYGDYVKRIGPQHERQNQRVQEMVGIVRLSNKRDHTWEHLGLRPMHIGH